MDNLMIYICIQREKKIYKFKITIKLIMIYMKKIQ